MEIMKGSFSCCSRRHRHHHHHHHPQLLHSQIQSQAKAMAKLNSVSFLLLPLPVVKLCHPFPLCPRPPKPLARSLLDDGGATSVTNVIDADSSLLVKKKAVEISSDLKGTSVFLVGMNCTMKTNLGKLLADALRYYYFDSDSLVEEAAGGKSAANSLRQRDVKGFRDSETEVLKQLSSMGRLVVCAGNGAVESATNLALLRHGISIWIDVPLDIVAREVLDDKIQFPASEVPSLGSYSEILSQLTVLYGEMREGYAIADVTVSLQKLASQLGYDGFDAVTIEDMGLEVLKEIERLMRVKKMIEDAARPF